jgi:hypothetical protein
VSVKVKVKRIGKTSEEEKKCGIVKRRWEASETRGIGILEIGGDRPKVKDLGRRCLKCDRCDGGNTCTYRRKEEAREAKNTRGFSEAGGLVIHVLNDTPNKVIRAAISVGSQR